MMNPFANRYLTPWNVVLLMNSSQVTVFGSLSTKQSVRIFYNIVALNQFSLHDKSNKQSRGIKLLYLLFFDAKL